jgi:hypothetical protein
MPRYRGMNISNIPNYDNDSEFQNFDFIKYLFSKEDLLEFYKEEKKDEDIEEITNRMSKIDLNTMKVSQLKRMCKNNGIKGYSKLKKNKLVELLKEKL